MMIAIYKRGNRIRKVLDTEDGFKVTGDRASLLCSTWCEVERLLIDWVEA